jgi:hypothetical protein
VCLWISLLSAPFILIKAILAIMMFISCPRIWKTQCFAGAYGLISLY